MTVTRNTRLPACKRKAPPTSHSTQEIGERRSQPQRVGWQRGAVPFLCRYHPRRKSVHTIFGNMLDMLLTSAEKKGRRTYPQAVAPTSGRCVVYRVAREATDQSSIGGLGLRGRLARTARHRRRTTCSRTTSVAPAHARSRAGHQWLRRRRAWALQERCAPRTCHDKLVAEAVVASTTACDAPAATYSALLDIEDSDVDSKVSDLRRWWGTKVSPRQE